MRFVGSTFYYLAEPETDGSVYDWFAALPEPPRVRRDSALLWFGSVDADVGANQTEQPIITMFPPRRVRHDVWTVGEVHCLARRGLFPDLDSAAAKFGRWLKTHPLVFRQPNATQGVDEWNWQLRGSIRNVAPRIYALPSGEDALNSGNFFVADRDTPETVTDVLREIDRLR